MNRLSFFMRRLLLSLVALLCLWPANATLFYTSVDDYKAVNDSGVPIVCPSGQTLYFHFFGTSAFVTFPNRVAGIVSDIPDCFMEFDAFCSLNESIYYDGFERPSGAVVIPETVEYNSQTYKVTYVESHAFTGCSGITSISVPSTMRLDYHSLYLGHGVGLQKIEVDVKDSVCSTDFMASADTLVFNGTWKDFYKYADSWYYNYPGLCDEFYSGIHADVVIVDGQKVTHHLAVPEGSNLKVSLLLNLFSKHKSFLDTYITSLSLEGGSLEATAFGDFLAFDTLYVRSLEEWEDVNINYSTTPHNWYNKVLFIGPEGEGQKSVRVITNETPSLRSIFMYPPALIPSIYVSSGIQFVSESGVRVDTLFFEGSLQEFFEKPVLDVSYNHLYVNSQEVKDSVSVTFPPEDMYMISLKNFPATITSVHVSKGYDFQSFGLTHVDTLFYDAPMSEWLKNPVLHLDYDVIFIDSKEVKENISLSIPDGVDFLTYDCRQEAYIDSGSPKYIQRYRTVCAGILDFPAKVTSLRVTKGYDFTNSGLTYVDTLIYEPSLSQWLVDPVMGLDYGTLFIGSEEIKGEMSLTIPGHVSNFTYGCHEESYVNEAFRPLGDTHTVCDGFLKFPAKVTSLHVSRELDFLYSGISHVDTLFYDAPSSQWLTNPIKNLSYDVLVIDSEIINNSFTIPGNVEEITYDCEWNHISPGYNCLSCKGLLDFPFKITSLHVSRGYDFEQSGLSYVDTLFYDAPISEWLVDRVKDLEFNVLYIDSVEMKGRVGGITIPSDVTCLKQYVNDCLAFKYYIYPFEGLPVEISSVHISHGMYGVLGCAVDTLYYDDSFSEWLKNPVYALLPKVLVIDSQVMDGNLSITIPSDIDHFVPSYEHNYYDYDIAHKYSGFLDNQGPLMMPANITSVHVSRGVDFHNSGLFTHEVYDISPTEKPSVDTLFYDASLSQWIVDSVTFLDYRVLVIDGMIKENGMLIIPDSARELSGEDVRMAFPDVKTIVLPYQVDWHDSISVDTLYFVGPIAQWDLRPRTEINAAHVYVNGRDLNDYRTLEVSVVGVDDSVYYDGREHLLSGYTFSCDDASYSLSDFELVVSDTIRAVESGAYTTSVTAADFRNLREDVRVTFSYTSGTLTILPVNYAFTSVCPTGQTLYYKMDGNSVKVTFPVYLKEDEDIPPTWCFGVDCECIYDAYCIYPTDTFYHGFVRPSGFVQIPDSVEYNSVKYRVTGIDDHAFYGCRELTGVSIPSHVKIGTHLFSYRLDLIEVVETDDVSQQYFQSFADTFSYIGSMKGFFDFVKPWESLDFACYEYLGLYVKTVLINGQSNRLTIPEGCSISSFIYDALFGFDNFYGERQPSLTSLSLEGGRIFLHDFSCGFSIDTLYVKSMRDWIQISDYIYPSSICPNYSFGDVLVIDSVEVKGNMSVTIPSDVDFSRGALINPFRYFPATITSCHVSRGIEFFDSGLSYVDTLFYDAPLSQWLVDSVIFLDYRVLVIDGMIRENGKLIVPDSARELSGEDVRMAFPDVKTIVLPYQVDWHDSISVDTLYFVGPIAQWDLRPRTEINAAHVYVNGRDLNDYQTLEVSVVGADDTVYYDGREHLLSGYTFSCDDASYSLSDFELVVSDTIRAVDPGVYYHKVTSGDFRNLNDDMRVRFSYTSGSLLILPPNYDFSAVCESGQTLYYQIMPGHNVRLICPRQNGLYPEDFLSGDLIIPDVVTHDGVRYKVSEIGVGLLKDNMEVTSIVIPKYMSYIEPDAFEGCGNLNRVVWNAVDCFLPDNSKSLFSSSSANIESFELGKNVRSIPASLCRGLKGVSDVVLPNSLEEIGEFAFSGCSLSEISFPETLEMIGSSAFDSCADIRKVTCPSVFPPEADRNTFFNYNGYLYVLCESYDDYDVHGCWGNFKHIECADSVPGNPGEVIVTPNVAEVYISWPASDRAVSYTLKITTNGSLVCSLKFDQTGTLVNIDFQCSVVPDLSPNASPRREGVERNVYSPAPRLVPTEGFSFTVTGLTGGTDYHYELEAFDEKKEVVAAYSGDFSTKSLPQTEDPILTDVDMTGSGRLGLYVSNMHIIFTNPKSLQVRIYNSLSQCLYVGDGPCDFIVPSTGVYMVSVGEESVKVLVE